MTREASRNDFSEQHCLRIISKKYYSMLKFDAVALDLFVLFCPIIGIFGYYLMFMVRIFQLILDFGKP